jgi:hypothetical protein
MNITGDHPMYPQPKYEVGDICLAYPVVDGMHRINRYVMVTEIYFDEKLDKNMYLYLDLAHDGQIWADSASLFEYRYGFVS